MDNLTKRKLDKCIHCEHYVSVGDGYGLCTKEAICVTVVDNYEPTKYLAYCEEAENENSI